MRHLSYGAYRHLLNNVYGLPESRAAAIDRALDSLHDAICHCDKTNREWVGHILGTRIIYELELWAKTKGGLEDELLDPETRAELLQTGADLNKTERGFWIHPPKHWDVLSRVKDHPDNMTPNDLQLFDDPNR